MREWWLNPQTALFKRCACPPAIRYEVDQLQSLRNSVRMELEDLELQLEERLLGLEEQLRARHISSPFRSSALVVGTRALSVALVRICL